ncbi:MAG: hypothetical protein QHH43_00565 [Candidatus Saccharicenans sp.]|jgi:hypothetical protein|nr:hypothetical protein [Candidatus Saccharicenans sp.]MDH7574236.1 hypothetical protein [Candidatus Saccharicenans sp.]
MNTSDDMKWAELLWDEYKYRHMMFWKSFYLWGGAAVTIFIMPFLKKELKVLNQAIFIFPLIGFIISLIGAWHLAAESERLLKIGEKYSQIRKEEYKPGNIYEVPIRTWYMQAVAEPIGKTLTFLFLFSLVIISIVDVLCLIIILYPKSKYACWSFYGSFFMLFFAIFASCMLINKKKNRYNKKIKK